MKLSWRQEAVLRAIGYGEVDIRKVSEEYRQRAIDLAMMEPPLVDIEADRLFLTDSGRRALKTNTADRALLSPPISTGGR